MRARTVPSAECHTRRLNLVHSILSEGSDFSGFCIDGDAKRDAPADLLLCLLFLGWHYEFGMESGGLPCVRERSDAF